MDDSMSAELCVQDLENAYRRAKTKEIILHFDRGGQFTNQLFREVLRHHKIAQSMSGSGHCYDNARWETLFAALKKEKLYPIDTTKLRSDDVKAIIFRYIHYYNLRRISSVNGGLPPLM